MNMDTDEKNIETNPPKKKPLPRANIRAVNKYNKKNYDRLAILVPKGQRDILRTHAESRGESLNGFVKRAIDETIERDKAK